MINQILFFFFLFFIFHFFNSWKEKEKEKEREKEKEKEKEKRIPPIFALTNAMYYSSEIFLLFDDYETRKTLMKKLKQIASEYSVTSTSLICSPFYFSDQPLNVEINHRFVRFCEEIGDIINAYERWSNIVHQLMIYFFSDELYKGVSLISIYLGILYCYHLKRPQDEIFFRFLMVLTHISSDVLCYKIKFY